MTNRTLLSHIVLFLMFLTMGVVPSSAQEFIEKLTDPNGAELDRFGSKVVLEGDWLFVTAYPDMPVVDAGAVHVYKREGSDWTLQEILTHDEPHMSDAFGLSMAADGDYLLLGSPLMDADGRVNNGVIYVYKRDGDRWVRQTKLSHPGDESEDWFGLSMALRGDVALVGAPQEDEGNVNTGAAYLYQREGEDWTQKARFTPGAVEQNHRFGTSVALGEGVAFVGAAYLTPGYTGTVYVYTEENGTWSLTDTLKPTNPDGVRSFGRSMTSDGNRLLVGDAIWEYNGLRNAGSVYVFEQENGIWTEQALLQAGDVDAGDYFGDNLAMWDRFIAVGARTIKAGDFQGVVYLFEHQSDTDTWQEVAFLAAADHGTDNFGFSPALDNGFLVTGAIGDREIADQAGAVFIYRIENINPAPSSPQLLTPEDGFRVTLLGDPDQPISATWTAATDPDGEAVTYAWQFSLTRDFGEPILTVEAGSATELTIEFGTLGGAMTDAGIFPVQTENVYHRVLASDGQSQTPSAVRYMRVTRDALTNVEDSETPVQFALFGNYPNPFNPQTTIRYALPQAAPVRLAVYDVLGREVALLVDQQQPVGTHEVAFEASGLPGGIYYYRIEAGSHTATRSLVLMK